MGTQGVNRYKKRTEGGEGNLAEQPEQRRKENTKTGKKDFSGTDSR